MCVDHHSQGTIQFEGLPRPVLAAAASIFGPGWFDGAPDGLAHATAGTYRWDDGATSAEYEIVLQDTGLAQLHIAYVPVPDAAAALDALNTASTTPVTDTAALRPAAGGRCLASSPGAGHGSVCGSPGCWGGCEPAMASTAFSALFSYSDGQVACSSE